MSEDEKSTPTDEPETEPTGGDTADEESAETADPEAEG